MITEIQSVVPNSLDGQEITAYTYSDGYVAAVSDVMRSVDESLSKSVPAFRRLFYAELNPKIDELVRHNTRGVYSVARNVSESIKCAMCDRT